MARGPLLSATAFDRAAHRRGDEAWLAAAWPAACVLEVSAASAAPVEIAPDGRRRLRFGTAADVPDDVPRRFLGLVGDTAYFTVTVSRDEGEWATLREIGPAADELDAGLLVSAVALEQWHQRHTHCPLCGSPTHESLAGWTRTCPNDGSEHFPRTDPAIITVVHDGGDRCLLGRNTAWPAGRYSTLAGFVEPGESLEAAVVREIHEEVAVDVIDVRYVASQPWPFPSSLMLGFSARVEGEQAVRPDAVEISEAGWFSRDEVRAAAARTDTNAEPDPDAVLQFISPPLSISRYLVDRWLAGEL